MGYYHYHYGLPVVHWRVCRFLGTILVGESRAFHELFALRIEQIMVSFSCTFFTGGGYFDLCVLVRIIQFEYDCTFQWFDVLLLFNSIRYKFLCAILFAFVFHYGINTSLLGFWIGFCFV